MLITDRECNEPPFWSFLGAVREIWRAEFEAEKDTWTNGASSETRRKVARARMIDNLRARPTKVSLSSCKLLRQYVVDIAYFRLWNTLIAFKTKLENLVLLLIVSRNRWTNDTMIPTFTQKALNFLLLGTNALTTFGTYNSRSHYVNENWKDIVTEPIRRYRSRRMK